MKVKSPNNVSELKSFLGMLNYYSKFIEQYTSMVNPLYKLLRKGERWVWSKECEKAFQAAKNSLISRKVLTHYNLQLPVKITCDASPGDVGAILQHIFPDGQVKPVAFASRVLTKAEPNIRNWIVKHWV